MENKEQVQTAPEGKNEEKKPQLVAFGKLGFEDLTAYENYITRMKQSNYSDILTIINTGVRSAVERGVYSTEENELLSVALRYLMGAFSVVPSEKEATEAEPAA